MEIFENLKYRLENASTEIKIYLVTFIIALFYASLIVTTYFFVTEHIVFKDSSPRAKKRRRSYADSVITQKPEAVRTDSAEEPQPPSTPLITKQAPITAAEAATLTRQAAVTRGTAAPIARDVSCNARLAAISNEVRMFAQAGIDAAIFTYGPADVSPLPSLDGTSRAFNAACVDTVSESLKSRGFGIERVEISPTEGTGHLIVNWGPAAASK